MTIIVIDGPEKAGKTHLIRELAGRLRKDGANVMTRKWGPFDPDDRVVLEPLKIDSGQPGIISIWDRSWVSEHVYATLLGRNRRLGDDPWLGEWLYGRAVRTNGMGLVLVADPEELGKRRDSSDLPVDPTEERQAFITYAARFGWNIYQNEYTQDSLEDLIGLIYEKVKSIFLPQQPPAYCGPNKAKIIVVGERRGQPNFPGAWLPFTEYYSIEPCRKLGDYAFDCGWTNCREVPPQTLRTAEVVISFGEVAAQWSRNYVCIPGSKITHIFLPHPAWSYRYHNEKASQAREDTEWVFTSLAAWLDNQVSKAEMKDAIAEKFPTKTK